MQGAYGGLIIIVMYAGGSIMSENVFLWLDNTPFTLLSGEHLLLL